jgi:hypothetical protein
VLKVINMLTRNKVIIFPADEEVAMEIAEIIRALGKSEEHACIASSSPIVLPAKGIFDAPTS